MSEILKVGDSVPPFFVKDHEGYDVSDEDVVGCPFIVYFYPKDETPGCTQEACEFRDGMKEFDSLQILILGVSPDSVESHQKFREKHQLEFSLLSDEKKDMCQMFGVLDKEGKIIRSTFVIDSRGIIKWMEKPVEVVGHVDRVLNAVKKYCKEEVISFDDFEKDYADFLKETVRINKEEYEADEKMKKDIH